MVVEQDWMSYHTRRLLEICKVEKSKELRTRIIALRVVGGPLAHSGVSLALYMYHESSTR